MMIDGLILFGCTICFALILIVPIVFGSKDKIKKKTGYGIFSSRI